MRLSALTLLGSIHTTITDATALHILRTLLLLLYFNQTAQCVSLATLLEEAISVKYVRLDLKLV
jgi:hypothetical protein